MKFGRAAGFYPFLFEKTSPIYLDIRGERAAIEEIFGSVLLSHTASRAVPSALKSLTSVFGMGTGVASSPSPPKNRCRRYNNTFGLAKSIIVALMQSAQFECRMCVLYIYVSYFVAKPHD